MKRVFLIVLDSFGIGELPDAARYGDEGSNTLRSIRNSPLFSVPNLAGLGLFHIEGVEPLPGQPRDFSGAVARMGEASCGKDTIIGHWEIAGLRSSAPLPTYPEGFPEEFCREFSRRTGRGLLCNRPYSGTAVLQDYGEEHLRTGDLILYTSADSVCQIAAHEAVVPTEQLYEYCLAARELLGVGRVIARPFVGDGSGFQRTSRRRDFSLEPPGETLLDVLSRNGLDVISIGKIWDIFSGRSIGREYHTADNRDGMERTSAVARERFQGLCFVNLVDFDMKYGHRNDVDGYAAAMTEFDSWLGTFLPQLESGDLLILTGDHGCDPATPSTDHSREYTPMLAAGAAVRPGTDLGTRSSFGDIGNTVLDYFGLSGDLFGESFLDRICL